jgi:hypothetical protein
MLGLVRTPVRAQVITAFSLMSSSSSLLENGCGSIAKDRALEKNKTVLPDRAIIRKPPNAFSWHGSP